MRKFNVTLDLDPMTFAPQVLVDILDPDGTVSNFTCNMEAKPGTPNVTPDVTTPMRIMGAICNPLQRLSLVKGIIELNELPELTDEEEKRIVTINESIKIGEEKNEKV